MRPSASGSFDEFDTAQFSCLRHHIEQKFATSPPYGNLTVEYVEQIQRVDSTENFHSKILSWSSGIDFFLVGSEK
jgi:hypothetical protein